MVKISKHKTCLLINNQQLYALKSSEHLWMKAIIRIRFNFNKVVLKWTQWMIKEHLNQLWKMMITNMRNNSIIKSLRRQRLRNRRRRLPAILMKRLLFILRCKGQWKIQGMDRWIRMMTLMMINRRLRIRKRLQKEMKQLEQKETIN